MESPFWLHCGNPLNCVKMFWVANCIIAFSLCLFRPKKRFIMFLMNISSSLLLLGLDWLLVLDFAFLSFITSAELLDSALISPSFFSHMFLLIFFLTGELSRLSQNQWIGHHSKADQFQLEYAWHTSGMCGTCPVRGSVYYTDVFSTKPPVKRSWALCREHSNEGTR